MKYGLFLRICSLFFFLVDLFHQTCCSKICPSSVRFEFRNPVFFLSLLVLSGAEMKRTICKYCDTVLVPGVTAIVRLSRMHHKRFHQNIFFWEICYSKELYPSSNHLFDLPNNKKSAHQGGDIATTTAAATDCETSTKGSKQQWQQKEEATETTKWACW